MSSSEERKVSLLEAQFDSPNVVALASNYPPFHIQVVDRVLIELPSRWP